MSTNFRVINFSSVFQLHNFFFIFALLCGYSDDIKMISKSVESHVTNPYQLEGKKIPLILNAVLMSSGRGHCEPSPAGTSHCLQWKTLNSKRYFTRLLKCTSHSFCLPLIKDLLMCVITEPSLHDGCSGCI